MTIIALHFINNQFNCYADTLVDVGSGWILTKYSKALPLTINFRNKISCKVISTSYSIGFAMSGNLAAATSFYTILSGCFQSLFANGEPNYPSIADISSFAKQAATEIYDDVRALGDRGFFGIFLFGFDFTEQSPFLIEIKPILDFDGVYQISSIIYHPKENFLKLMGSGKTALTKYISELPDQ